MGVVFSPGGVVPTHTHSLSLSLSPLPYGLLSMGGSLSHRRCALCREGMPLASFKSVGVRVCVRAPLLFTAYDNERRLSVL
jgi:hypothetical protein